MQSVIDQVSELHSTPSFLPHVTLASAIATPQQARSALAPLGGTGSVRGEMRAPFRGDGTKISLTMGYKFALAKDSVERVEALAQHLCDVLDADRVTQANLHLSLLYKSGGVTSDEGRQIETLAQACEIVDRPVELTDIVAVTLDQPFFEEVQIRQWRPVASVRLDNTRSDSGFDDQAPNDMRKRAA